MSANRLADYIEHIRQAAGDACQFVQGMVWETLQTALPALLEQLPAVTPAWQK